ncbi:unnamed protein product, partial [Coccothraustes coccothraustes]
MPCNPSRLAQCPGVRVASWLLKFHIVQDASQTQAGNSAKSGLFQSAKWLLQTDTKNLA